MDKDELRQLYGDPRELVLEAHAPFLDETARQVIRACRLLFISTLNPEGFPDISPRGGDAGFVHIVDDTTIEFLDVPGNKKVMTLSNIAGEQKIGVLFVVAGKGEMLRLYGRAELIHAESDIRARGGEIESNRILVRVHIDKVFPHCSKAMMHADLWNTDSWNLEAVSELPTVVDMAKSMAAARISDEEDPG